MGPLDESRLFDWKDSVSWASMLSALAGRRAGRRIVAAELTVRYDGVVAYHGCRPEDIESYYRDGIQPSSNAALDAKAKEIFCSPAVGGVTPEAIDAITADLGRRDQGRIYACLDDRHLIAHAAHYVIYGSERLQCVAAALSTKWRNLMPLLKRYGKPTIFRLALPWETITESDFEALARSIGSHVGIVRERLSVPESWFSFEFGTPLPARFVLAHEHPQVLVDPHDGMKAYKYEPTARDSRDL
jgi:hypothetical protein